MLPWLHKMIAGRDEQLALEALWALYVSGGWNDEVALELLDHPAADVRTWTVRLVGDDRRELADGDSNRSSSNWPPAIRARRCAASWPARPSGCRRPMVCRSSRRCSSASEDAGDPHIPLLLWWAIEDKAVSDRDAVLALLADESNLAAAAGARQ